jgi:hypothetical protein
MYNTQVIDLIGRALKQMHENTIVSVRMDKTEDQTDCILGTNDNGHKQVWIISSEGITEIH